MWRRQHSLVFIVKVNAPPLGAFFNRSQWRSQINRHRSTVYKRVINKLEFLCCRLFVKHNSSFVMWYHSIFGIIISISILWQAESEWVRLLESEHCVELCPTNASACTGTWIKCNTDHQEVRRCNIRNESGESVGFTLVLKPRADIIRSL